MDSRMAVTDAIRQASEYLLSIQRDTDYFWCAELESNATLTAEYVMLCQILGLQIEEERVKKIVKYFCEHQNPDDGSWTIGYGVEGDISTTTESYLALTILGLDSRDSVLRKAKSFILKKGGLARVRIFTRINLALFGLFSWDAVPALPAEVILLPPQMSVNLYNFSSWSRSTIVPLLVISNHRPVYRLPNGMCYTMMDELWVTQAPADRKVPYQPPLGQVLKKNGASWKSLVSIAEQLLKVYEKFKVGRLRKYALSKCMKFIVDHQEVEGDTAGIIPPMVYGVLAMTLEGYSVDSKEVKKGIQAIERFSWETHGEYRIQSCVSPVWDTCLSTIALLDCGLDPKDIRIEGAIRWMLDRQILLKHGDWKVYRPNLESGGWSFEYFNSWYPDVDDSAVVLIALFKHDPNVIHSPNIQKGLRWVLGMQNRDGGWGAFDVDNDKLFLNDIPFSDMGALCDPSSPDVAGHMLETLGIYLEISREYKWTEPHQALRSEAEASISKGIKYLRDSQEVQGSWYGRWGVNYIYGTSGALCGLAAVDFPLSDPMVARGIEWLKDCQNEDGGWGEGVESYRDKRTMGTGIESTASQTAWAIMALLAYLPAEDLSIKRGIRWLLQNFVKPSNEPAEAYESGLKVPANNTIGGTWNEKHFTGTGFPNHFYIRYHLYRHYFPLSALGRFLQSSSASAGA